MRRIPALASLLLASAALHSAHAQIVSVYGTFSASHLSGVHNGNSGLPPGYVTTDFWSPGVGAGLTFNILPIGPVRLGLDLRGSTKPGTSGSDLVLVGPRLGVKLPLIRLKPYIQASGGYLRTRTALATSSIAGSTFTQHFGAYEVLGGVDYSALPFIDLRLIEIGGGKGYLVSAAGISSSYDVTLYTINSGIVFHF